MKHAIKETVDCFAYTFCIDVLLVVKDNSDLSFGPFPKATSFFSVVTVDLDFLPLCRNIVTLDITAAGSSARDQVALQSGKGFQSLLHHPPVDDQCHAVVQCP